MAKEVKFTAGPWETYAEHVYSPGTDGANICSMSEPYASTSVGYTKVQWKSPHLTEVYANARLIAAAPDMLAALKAVDALGMLNPTGSGTVEDAARAVKAAIARAEAQP